MAKTYTQTGYLKTVVALRNTDAHLNHGNWLSYPISSVSVGTDNNQIFVGDNEGVSTICSDGYVVYTAADGTEFRLDYNCTMSGKNDISMTIQKLSGPWAHGSIIATDGFNSCYYWEIIQTSDFVDAPVFPEDILKAEKCNSISNEKILKYIDGRHCVYLKDCLAVNSLPAFAKVWCIQNPLFLTPASKALLLRDLAQESVQELLKDRGEMASVIEPFCEYNHKMVEGNYSTNDVNKHERTLNLFRDSILDTEQAKRRYELSNVWGCLLRSDFDKSWADAVESYIGFAAGEELEKRYKKIISLVERRL